ncbi:MAG: hypothetical protein JXA46_13570 [Dehalococcoidales bacterium]|nr:hypothetical protein [Dehalococcoidales bacterium]
MGWGRMFLLGDWGQQMDIEDQRREIEELRQQIKSEDRTGETNLTSRISELEKENGELRLYLASLIRYLGHKGVLRQNEFSRLVEAVDIEDGSADSSFRGKIIK